MFYIIPLRYRLRVIWGGSIMSYMPIIARFEQRVLNDIVDSPFFYA